MPKVKIFVLLETLSNDYHEISYRLGPEVTDWEEVSEEDHSRLIANKHLLERHLIASSIISQYQQIVIVTQELISANKAIDSIKDLLIKAEQKELERKKKEKDAAKIQEKKKKERELKKLKQLKEKYESET